MPKKTPSVIEKISNFAKLHILLAKLRKPITLNLIFIREKTSLRQCKYHRHYYHYGFVEEFQFSSSSTPLMFPRPKKQYLSNTEWKNRKFYSMLLKFMCLRDFGAEEKEELNYPSLEILPPIVNEITNDEEEDELQLLETGSDECSLLSVDDRAERFIQKFYAQMRMQGQEASNTISLLLGD